MDLDFDDETRAFQSEVREFLAANTASFGLQMAIIYVPFLQPIFKTQALSPLDLVVILVFSTLPFWTMEAVKALNSKVHIYAID